MCPTESVVVRITHRGRLPSDVSGLRRAGVRHDAVLRRLAHVPFGWKPTILEVVVPRYRCWPCGRVWRHDVRAAAPSKGRLSRGSVMQAVKSIVVDRMSIARVAANLGVASDPEIVSTSSSVTWMSRTWS